MKAYIRSMEENNLYVQRRIAVACVLMSISVMLGAFGAHALKEKLDEHQLSTYETSTRYLVYHALALLILSIVHVQGLLSKMAYVKSYRFFIIGISIFSGSLYLLTFLQAAGVKGMEWLGAITPFGGMTFILTWLYTAFQLVGKKK
jgi:uncharacterized membrane protein YgdD (TMEM256/DUF423 family)